MTISELSRKLIDICKGNLVGNTSDEWQTQPQTIMKRPKSQYEKGRKKKERKKKEEASERRPLAAAASVKKTE